MSRECGPGPAPPAVLWDLHWPLDVSEPRFLHLWRGNSCCNAEPPCGHRTLPQQPGVGWLVGALQRTVLSVSAPVRVTPAPTQHSEVQKGPGLRLGPPGGAVHTTEHPRDRLQCDSSRGHCGLFFPCHPESQNPNLMAGCAPRGPGPPAPPPRGKQPCPVSISGVLPVQGSPASAPVALSLPVRNARGLPQGAQAQSAEPPTSLPPQAPLSGVGGPQDCGEKPTPSGSSQIYNFMVFLCLLKESCDYKISDLFVLFPSFHGNLNCSLSSAQEEFWWAPSSSRQLPGLEGSTGWARGWVSQQLSWKGKGP